MKATYIFHIVIEKTIQYRVCTSWTHREYVTRSKYGHLYLFRLNLNIKNQDHILVHFTIAELIFLNVILKMVRGAQERKKLTDSEQRRMFVFCLLDILLDMVWLCTVFFSLRVESSSFFQTLKTRNVNLLHKSADNSRLVLVLHKL